LDFKRGIVFLTAAFVPPILLGLFWYGEYYRNFFAGSMDPTGAVILGILLFSNYFFSPFLVGCFLNSIVRTS
jgi:hypothetical protein